MSADLRQRPVDLRGAIDAALVHLDQDASTPASRAKGVAVWGQPGLEAKNLARRFVDLDEPITRGDASSDLVWGLARASAAGFIGARHSSMLQRGVLPADAACWRDAKSSHLRRVFGDTKPICAKGHQRGGPRP
jgi:hypothetical protein